MHEDVIVRRQDDIIIVPASCDDGARASIYFVSVSTSSTANACRFHAVHSAVSGDHGRSRGTDTGSTEPKMLRGCTEIVAKALPETAEEYTVKSKKW